MRHQRNKLWNSLKLTVVLLSAMLVTSCAMPGFLTEPPAPTLPIPPNLLESIPLRSPDDAGPKSILLWGIEEHSDAKKANCRFYEARKFNSLSIEAEFIEVPPIYCQGIITDE